MLPAASLDERDFLQGRTVADLCARLFTIADKTGNGKILGRIRTMEALHIHEAVTLNDWWKLSNYRQKLTLLASGGRSNEILNSVVSNRASMIQDCLCPFRESGVVLVQEEASVADESMDEDFDHGVNITLDY
jgi:hypothetical protein